MGIVTRKFKFKGLARIQIPEFLAIEGGSSAARKMKRIARVEMFYISMIRSFFDVDWQPESTGMGNAPHWLE